jgi:hypothetical protein
MYSPKSHLDLMSNKNAWKLTNARKGRKGRKGQVTAVAQPEVKNGITLGAGRCGLFNLEI